MNQDDQRFVLMAAAAQAHYAKQQARREARKAALLSQVSALSDSSQPMDPKLQAELERLIRAEAQRTEQENFDWACGMVVGVIVLVGSALFISTAMGAAGIVWINRAQAKVTRWPNQGMRHSYCSYWLALHKDVNELVLQSGHKDPDDSSAS
jgi:hypothetical protein